MKRRDQVKRHIVFNPLDTVTAEQAEERAGKLSDRVEKPYKAGLLT